MISRAILISSLLLLLKHDIAVAWSPSSSFDSPALITGNAFRTRRYPAHSSLSVRQSDLQWRRSRQNKEPLTIVYQSAVVEETSASSQTSSSSSSSSSVVLDVENVASAMEENANPLISQEATVAVTTTKPDYDDIVKKSLNAVLLISAAAYAAYNIFHVNADMSRGWTQSEIAMRIPLDTWSSYENSLADNPIYTKTMINVVIYLLGDWLSQTVFQGKNVLDFDAGRTLRNGLIGLCFGPLVHEYYQWSDKILPVEGGQWNRIQKIFMDQTIYLSVKCSIYIAAVSLLQGDDWKTASTNVKERLPKVCFTAWKFWPLVHLVTYNVIPARHRILWVNCVDLIWNAILASMSQKKPVEEVAEGTATDPAALAEAEFQKLILVEEEMLLAEDQAVSDLMNGKGSNATATAMS